MIIMFVHEKAKGNGKSSRNDLRKSERKKKSCVEIRKNKSTLLK